MVTAAMAAMAVTGTVGLVPTPAQAEQDYPSWNDVQKAKRSEAATRAEVARIVELVEGLQLTADTASREAKIKAEAYLVTKDALEQVADKAAALQKRADAAKKTAEISKMRAGLLSAHLAKTGGHDLSLNLLLSGGAEADNLLYQLGTMSKLSAQSQQIYAEATRDKNEAESLTEAAEAARAERERLADEAKTRLAEAEASSAAARAALARQVEKSTTMIEQLAVLKDSTVEIERAFLEGEAARRAAEAPPPVDPPRLPVPAPGTGSGTGAGSTPGGSAPGASTPGGTTPDTGGGTAGPSTNPNPAPSTRPSPPPSSNPSAPAPKPSPSPTTPKPSPSTTTPKPSPSPTTPKPSPSPSPTRPPEPDPVRPPNSSTVESAISFARAQLGKPYKFAGAGPNVWDCSGLTMRSYEAAGVYIGSHSATSQYLTMSGQGKLVPFSERQRGDLIWWSYNGSTSGIYHVAIYLGGGMILEAPDEGKTVREYFIWGMGDVLGYVGRPSA